MAKKSFDCIIIQFKEWFNRFLESTVNTLRSFAFRLQTATSLWTSWRRSHHLGWASGRWFTLKHQRASPPSILTAMTSQLGPWVPESAHLLLSVSSRISTEAGWRVRKLPCIQLYRKCSSVTAAGQLPRLLPWSQLSLLLWKRHQREAAGNALNNGTLVWRGELISRAGLLTAESLKIHQSCNAADLVAHLQVKIASSYSCANRQAPTAGAKAHFTPPPLSNCSFILLST